MFIVRTFTVKPAGTSWHKTPEGSTETLTQFAAAQLAAGGYIKLRTRKIGRNKVVKTMVFADQAAYDAWQAAISVHPDFIAKAAYNEANGITKVVKKFQLVE